MGRTGSSPLARGLPQANISELLGTRIIPARAGFTLAVFVTSWAREDHPRSRGVYCKNDVRATREVGSSPLARGLRARKCAKSCRIRIIPARAGFTMFYAIRFPNVMDHPRSRGVYMTVLRPFLLMTGSSPLARGLRRVLFRRGL